MMRLFCVGLLMLAPYVVALSLDDVAKPKWREVSTENFHIITDANVAKSRALISDLENFRFFLSAIEGRQLLEGVPPVKILAVSRRQTFKKLGMRDTLKGAFLKTEDGSFAIANVMNYTKNSSGVSLGKHVLMHEYVHYAMSNMFDVEYHPRWYKEGMADYYGTFQYNGNSISLGSIDALKHRFETLREKKKQTNNRLTSIDVESLFKESGPMINNEKRKTSGSERRQGSLYYARSMSLIHYMYATQERKKKLESYIDYINEGISVDDAFQRAFKTTFSELDAEVEGYINSDHMSGWTFRADDRKIDFPEVEARIRVLDEVEKYYHLFDVMLRIRTEDYEQKLALLSEAYKAHPDHEGLKVLAAYFVYNLSQEDGVRMLKSVVKQNSKHSYALSLIGEAYFREASTYRKVAHPSADERFDLARRYFRKAIVNNPFDGRANLRIGNIYTAKVSNEGAEEGIASYDNARFLISWHDVSRIDYEDAMLRLRVSENAAASKLLTKYNRRNPNHWSRGYGQFLSEVLAVNMIAEKIPVKSERAYIYSDGSLYIGELKHGKPHGEGAMVYSNGSKVQGKWRNGRLNGKSQFFATNGFVYRGDFSRGELSGQGRLVYPERSRITASEGSFKNGIEHGEHAFFYRDGRSEQGSYWLGKRHGTILLKMPNGQSTEREYIYGVRKTNVDADTFFVGPVGRRGTPSAAGVCQKVSGGLPYKC